MNGSSISRARTAAAGVAALGIAGASWVLFSFDPSRVPIYPICLFHELTGLDCPGCGSLRALHALLNGEWAAALHFNLMLVLSLPLAGWLGFRWVRNRFFDGTPLVFRPLWVGIYAGVWVAFGIARNLPFPWCAAFGQ